MYRVADGLITEADFASDDLRMFRQRGAIGDLSCPADRFRSTP